jgi:hypothetical protein
LVGPAGQTALIVSDAGGGNALNNLTLSVADAAGASLPDTGPIVPGTFKPTDYDPTTDLFPSPAPAGPYLSSFSVFNGQPANGNWALYVLDDGPGDQGAMAGGWTLTLMTASAAATPANVAPSRIASIVLDTGGLIHIAIQGEIGVDYAVESSSDLIHWRKLGEWTNTSGVIDVDDQVVEGSSLFYRVVSLPNVGSK